MRLSKTLWTGILACDLITWGAVSMSGKTAYIDDARNFGDINGDCRVDWSDFAPMSLHWPESSGP